MEKKSDINNEKITLNTTNDESNDIYENIEISDIDEGRKEGHQIYIVYDDEKTPEPELIPVEEKVGVTDKEAILAYSLPSFLRQVASYNTGKFVFTSETDEALISDFQKLIGDVESRKNSNLRKYTRGPYVIYFIPNSLFFAVEKKLQDEDGHINFEDRETTYLLHEKLIYEVYNKYKPYKKQPTFNTYSDEDILSACQLGFTKALNTYSNKKNSKFSTYAFYLMERECINVLRHYDTKKKKTNENKKVIVTSITENEEEDTNYIGIEGDLELVELQCQLDSILKSLPAETELVIRCFFGIGREKITQLQIADMLHCSQSLIHIKIKEALELLNIELTKDLSNKIE